MIAQLKEVFGTYTKAIEVLYVLKDAKPVARLSFFETELPKVFGFCKKNNLYIERSDFKVVMAFDGNYSTKGVKISKENPFLGHFFVYISKEKSKVDEAKHFEHMGNYKKFGLALGYPECCCAFFAANKADEEKKSNDYIEPALKQSEGTKFPFYMNVFGRYFDMPLLTHCPCSFNCKPSLKLAKKYFGIIEKDNKHLAEHLKHVLKTLALYSETQGVFLLKGNLSKNKFDFKGILNTKNSPLYTLLKMNKNLGIIDKNNIKIRDKEVPNVHALIFG